MKNNFRLVTEEWNQLRSSSAAIQVLSVGIGSCRFSQVLDQGLGIFNWIWICCTKKRE